VICAGGGFKVGLRLVYHADTVQDPNPPPKEEPDVCAEWGLGVDWTS